MKYKAMHVALVALAAALVADPALAQHEGHQTGQAAPATAPTTGAVAKDTGMMCGGMMAHMNVMKSNREEQARIVAELAKNQLAMEMETVPAALQAGIRRHGELLRQLQTKMQAETKEMESICGKAGAENDRRTPDAAPGAHSDHADSPN